MTQQSISFGLKLPFEVTKLWVVNQSHVWDLATVFENVSHVIFCQFVIESFDKYDPWVVWFLLFFRISSFLSRCRFHIKKSISHVLMVSLHGFSGWLLVFKYNMAVTSKLATILIPWNSNRSVFWPKIYILNWFLVHRNLTWSPRIHRKIPWLLHLWPCKAGQKQTLFFLFPRQWRRLDLLLLLLLLWPWVYALSF